MEQNYSYWKQIWRQFLKHRLGVAALCIVALFCLAGIYAPFLASSKPIAVKYDGVWYFPLFRYLFFTGFYTKLIDIFFNLLMFTFPLYAAALLRLRGRRQRGALLCLTAVQLGLFLYIAFNAPSDPAADPLLARERQAALEQKRRSAESTDFAFDLRYMNSYAKLNLVLKNRLKEKQHERIVHYSGQKDIPTLWHVEKEHERKREETYREKAPDALRYLMQKRQWLAAQNEKITFEWMPLIRDFHWEDDAGGDQRINQFVPWWELTRINRKDLVAALIFGVRISLVIGILAVSLALAIGIPIGCYSGYYGGKLDMLVCRLLEIWESMPTFFMLLLVVAITQSKSIFIVITVVGVFGWTGFSRYIRGEFFKQRNLPYVEACHALGFRDPYIMFTHILPNAIPPVLTLLPFAVMGAITSEAGLSFLGLGEEGSCSWGVLMDEGRSAFPGESYLLWPPALLLTTLLVSIALVGDAWRDSIDPKMQK